MRAEIDRLTERADVFNNFIRDLMERVEHSEKAIAALQTELKSDNGRYGHDEEEEKVSHENL